MTVQLAAPTFLHPVIYDIPGDHGERLEIKFHARFRRLKKSQRELLAKRLHRSWLAGQLRNTTSPEIRALLEQHVAELGEDIQVITDLQICQLVLDGWQLHGLDGQPVPFDDASLEALAEDWEGIEGAIAKAYVEATAPRAAEKNSGKPSPTTSGQTAPTTA